MRRNKGNKGAVAATGVNASVFKRKQAAGAPDGENHSRRNYERT